MNINMISVLLDEHYAQSKALISDCSLRLQQGEEVAHLLFSPLEKSWKDYFEEQRGAPQAELGLLVREADIDLAAWKRLSGRSQHYTPESLARARLKRTIANQYHNDHAAEFMAANALHQAIVTYTIVHSGLAAMMIQEGKKGHKFAAVEVASRLTPSLTFPGASDYLYSGSVTYDKDARKICGVELPFSVSLVSEQAAMLTAQGVAEKGNVAKVLAETSIAPRMDVPKSGREPEVYIAALSSCQTSGPEKKVEVKVQHFEIPTLFRESFDALVREKMFRALQEMYAKNVI